MKEKEYRKVKYGDMPRPDELHKDILNKIGTFVAISSRGKNGSAIKKARLRFYFEDGTIGENLFTLKQQFKLMEGGEQQCVHEVEVASGPVKEDE